MRGASAARVWLPALAWSLLVRDAAVIIEKAVRLYRSGRTLPKRKQ
jgi:hypothetical protein